MLRIKVLAWAIAVLTALAPCTGLGQAAAHSAESKREASAHFRRGVQLYQEGAYRSSLIELERAFDVVPDYRVLFNIGQCNYALGEYVEASRAFESYLSLGGTAIAAARREEVSKMVVELKQRLAYLRIDVDQDGAIVFVDGNRIGTSPLRDTVPLSVGRHEIRAELDEGGTAVQTVDVASGDRSSVELTIIAPALVEETPPPPPPAPPTLSRRKRWGWAMIGVGAAAGLSGAVMAALAKKADGDYIDALHDRPGNASRIASAHDDLQRNAITADVLFGTAVAAVATGLVLVLIKEPNAETQPKRGDVQLGFGYQSVVATGRF